VPGRLERGLGRLLAKLASSDALFGSAPPLVEERSADEDVYRAQTEQVITSCAEPGGVVLGRAAAVVLDPPHNGAAAQIGQVAAAGVPTVVYVSCNPATLSRDARVLRSAGYELAAATAIDQFLWSARLESVSVFRRG